MRLHQVLHARALPWLFAGAVGAFVWADSPPADAAFTATPGSASVAIAGASVTAPGAPDVVVFSGRATVNTTAVTDPDFGGPTNVVITVDLSGLAGKGLPTNTAYTTTAKQVFVRPLVPADTVDFTFPFFPAGATPTTPARLAKATVVLVYNPLTGMLRSGNVVVTAP